MTVSDNIVSTSSHKLFEFSRWQTRPNAPSIVSRVTNQITIDSFSPLHAGNTLSSSPLTTIFSTCPSFPAQCDSYWRGCLVSVRLIFEYRAYMNRMFKILPPTCEPSASWRRRMSRRCTHYYSPSFVPALMGELQVHFCASSHLQSRSRLTVCSFRRCVFLLEIIHSGHCADPFDWNHSNLAYRSSLTLDPESVPHLMSKSLMTAKQKSIRSHPAQSYGHVLSIVYP